MGFNTVPYEPYCIIKEGVLIFFYIKNIVFIFWKNKTGIVKGVIKELKIKYQFIGGEEF